VGWGELHLSKPGGTLAYLQDSIWECAISTGELSRRWDRREAYSRAVVNRQGKRGYTNGAAGGDEVDSAAANERSSSSWCWFELRPNPLA
jgi:hypothetical protein